MGDTEEVLAGLGDVKGSYFLAIGATVRFNAASGLLHANYEYPSKELLLSFGKEIAIAHLDAIAQDISSYWYYLSGRQITTYHHGVFDLFGVNRRFYGGSYITGRHDSFLELSYCQPACD